MPEWMAATAVVIAWANGLMLGGILWARSPFWDGVRSIFTFGRSPHDR